MSKIDKKVVKKLEKTKNEALKRVSEQLKQGTKLENGEATHSSHSSGGGRTHTSVVTA